MARPKDIGVIDTLIGFRDVRQVGHVAAAKDQGKRHPAEYMFKTIPEELAKDADRYDAIDDTVAEMDKCGVALGLVSLGDERTVEALRRHPTRFAPTLAVDANDGVMTCLQKIQRAVETHGARGVTIFPAGARPQVAINDKLWYPVYAKCAELKLPLFTTVGVPGPRVPMMAQYVGHLDEVCYDFPELNIVMRHGADPWVDLAVKLLLKWPNLYYSTTAFAPKYWSKEIIEFANTRGADKVLYGGYFPFGLELERIFREMDDVPFKAEVWPKFLRGNAARLLGLGA
jgi:predicted TIM-barrel fold metal-dependent hydrolase